MAKRKGGPPKLHSCITCGESFTTWAKMVQHKELVHTQEENRRAIVSSEPIRGSGGRIRKGEKENDGNDLPPDLDR